MEKTEKTYVLKILTKPDELQEVYDGSCYTICGCGGNITEWTDGISDLMEKQGIGKPKIFYIFSGKLINEFAGQNGDPFKEELIALAFSHEGLDVGKLAMFKIGMGDRWFDDIIDNMRRRALSDEAQ